MKLEISPILENRSFQGTRDTSISSDFEKIKGDYFYKVIFQFNEYFFPEIRIKILKNGLKMKSASNHVD